jgi:hypothetical protein
MRHDDVHGVPSGDGGALRARRVRSRLSRARALPWPRGLRGRARPRMPPRAGRVRRRATWERASVILRAIPAPELELLFNSSPYEMRASSNIWDPPVFLSTGATTVQIHRQIEATPSN